MSFPREYDEHRFFSDNHPEEKESEQDLAHKRELRKLLEEKLERKRLKEELEDAWDEEFDLDKELKRGGGV